MVQASDLRGSMVAIVTPFREGRVDEAALRDLVRFHLHSGTDAIVPCGTTGESATLSHEEHQRVVEVVLEAAEGRVPVIAGTGSNSTAEALRLTKHAERAGATAALLITPYYNRPTQEGLYRHFRAIAEEVDLPLILYNVPGRTGVNLLPETVARLSELPNVVGIKEASGSLRQASEIVELCGPDFCLLSGDDFLTLPILSVGGRGVISVTANVAPARVAEMCRAFEAGELERARRLHYELLPLTRALFLETNPIPVKTALGLMGRIDPELRLPLCPMSPANRERLAEALRRAGLL